MSQIETVKVVDESPDNDQGFKIINASDLTDSDVVFDESGLTDPAKMKIADLREHLKGLGIDFDADAKKPDLLKLLPKE